jgi:GH25 family lysozyme M1 (1,4-beta-N-acetylmuramidase)
MNKYINRAVRNFKKVSFERAKELKETYEDKLLNEGAIAVGHDDEGLVVFTNKELPTLNSYTLSKVKIVKVDKFKALRTERHRPIQGGISIGHKDITAGTMSLLVKDKSTCEPLILSNNHVLANINRGKPGDAIFQPGKADGGSSSDTVGYLDRFAIIENGATIDAAVAKLSNNKIALTGIWNLLPAVNGNKEPTVGMQVKKYGRTTDLTYGQVTALNASVTVDYGGVAYTLKDCVICKLPSAPGDSGSPILETGTNKLVGILFAGDGQYTICSKFSNIASQLNVDTIFDNREVVLDLSKWNGKILDVNKMRANNVIAVIIKITQGDYYKDEKFDEFWSILKDAHIPVSAYIFVDPKISAEKHFEFFKESIGDKVSDFSVGLDCEWDNGQSKERITAVIQKLASLLDGWHAQFNFPPTIIYTRGSWWNTYVSRWSGWQNYGLWVARWGTDNPWYGMSDPYRPADWNEWLLWQYSADGNMEGREYGLDCNSVDKSIPSSKFKEIYISGNPVPPPPPPPEYKYVGTVIVDGLRIRKLPSITAQIVGMFQNGTRLNILDIVEDVSGNKWAKLDVDKYSAYIYNNKMFIDISGYNPPAINKGKVIVSALNVRDNPSVLGNKVGVVYNGTIVPILEKVNDSSGNIWVRIDTNKYCAMVYNGIAYIKEL